MVMKSKDRRVFPDKIVLEDKPDGLMLVVTCKDEGPKEGRRIVPKERRKGKWGLQSDPLIIR